MKKSYIIAIILFLWSSMAFAKQKVNVSSPNKNLVFELQLQNGTPNYKVSYKNKVIIDNSTIGFDFDSGQFGSDLVISNPKFRTGKESYDLIVGKAKHVNSHYKEVIIPLQETKGLKRLVNMTIRAFDDGIAFRYDFPKQANWQSYVMYDEQTNFKLLDDPKALTLFLPSYTSSHEGEYTNIDYNKIEGNTLMDLPITLEFKNGTYLSITEAAVVDYAGMYLMKEADKFVSKLSPLPGQTKEKVKVQLPHKTPWRVLSISDRLGDLIETNILTNLNEPCKFEDISWIDPGMTTFTWWNGNVVPDTTFLPGNNFETNKYYIDFARRNNLKYHSIYGYAEQPWYLDDGFDFSTPGENVDITKAINSLDMQAICDYAGTQDIRIHLWVNWKALYPQIDKAFQQFEKWGIAGMMVDFMDRDDQEMIQIQEEILAKAGKHKLFVQFHGSSKPSGLHRTYPNEFTREGTLNYENYKWGTRINADHDISMPFTRLLAGAADYHLGGFRSVPESEFKIQYTNPLVTSTRCHMLAMYVVLESYLGMLCDTPKSYEGQDGFEFLQTIPTTWDKTRVLNASLNEYVTIARKKDKSWYVGALNNSTARNVNISFDFLDKGKTYEAEIYTDHANVHKNPNLLNKKLIEVKQGDTTSLSLASAGGAVIRITER